MKKVLVALDYNVYEKLKQNGKISKQIREALEKYLNEANNSSSNTPNEVNKSDL